MVAVSVCMGGTHGSGVLYSTGDVLEMSVVRGVCGVCGMCLARVSVPGEGGEWMRGLGLGFINPVGTGGVLDVCLWFGGVGRGLGPGSGGVLLCLCESGFSVLMAGICVLCLADTCASEVHPVFNRVPPCHISPNNWARDIISSSKCSY